MAAYKLREICYTEIDLDPADLLSLSQAARVLGMTSPGVVRAVERGKLRAVVDTEKKIRGGSMRLLREDVERWASLRLRERGG